MPGSICQPNEPVSLLIDVRFMSRLGWSESEIKRVTRETITRGVTREAITRGVTRESITRGVTRESDMFNMASLLYSTPYQKLVYGCYNLGDFTELIRPPEIPHTNILLRDEQTIASQLGQSLQRSNLGDQNYTGELFFNRDDKEPVIHVDRDNIRIALPYVLSVDEAPKITPTMTNSVDNAPKITPTRTNETRQSLYSIADLDCLGEGSIIKAAKTSGHIYEGCLYQIGLRMGDCCQLLEETKPGQFTYGGLLCGVHLDIWCQLEEETTKNDSTAS